MKSQKLAAILAVTVLGTCSMTFAENPIIRMNSIEVSAADVEATYIGSGYQLNYKTVDNNIEITNFTKTSSASSVSVVIPSKINGCSVTSIGAYAFSGKDISSVIIPDTVVSLGNYSFYNCSKLKTVTLSKNLSSEKSGGYLFYKSKNIEIVNVPENMADPSFVDHFNYYTNTVVQGSSVTSAYKLDYKISDHQIEITSFTKTTSASAVGVIIPSTINGYNVTSIGKFAFYCCDGISSIVMPDTVISLGDYSFSTCSNLKTVTLSRNLSSEKSGGYLFYNSTSIETVYVPENMIDQTFIDHFNYHLDTVIKGSVNNSQYRLDYEIPIKDRNATITKYNANANASDNVTVTIPDTILGRNVTKIATGAFSSSNVYQVIMSNNITTLESWSFNGCANLKKLTVSKNVSCAQSGGYLFTGCNNLTDITVPADMADREFISHFQYCIGGAKLIKPDVDAKVTQVYNNLKSKSANVNWNISGLSGNAKEALLQMLG
ncbi:leucine-rich repeat domain-containing protein [uncultured Ruminococcus sp.]|uniref:leucine-rich repeat domain-containing protein n=1 Tax=uncultured Ruminococcus sp. TaxID=165186 RepID=UPI00266BFD23|nr:leucine-rich repeat domain-containing protein [uncultured Ruminococcus sp.]